MYSGLETSAQVCPLNCYPYRAANVLGRWVTVSKRPAHFRNMNFCGRRGATRLLVRVAVAQVSRAARESISTCRHIGARNKLSSSLTASRSANVLAAFRVPPGHVELARASLQIDLGDAMKSIERRLINRREQATYTQCPRSSASPAATARVDIAIS